MELWDEEEAFGGLVPHCDGINPQLSAWMDPTGGGERKSVPLCVHLGEQTFSESHPAEEEEVRQ